MSNKSPLPPNDEWDVYVAGLRSGDAESCLKFWAQFGNSLKRVSERHISHQMSSRIDADDVVQSACRTFFRRANNGEFLLHDDSQLWRLLCAITITKARGQARFHSREKRSVQSEHLVSSHDADTQNMDQIPGPASSAESDLILAEAFESTLSQFNTEEQRVIDMKLRNLDNSEIASTLVCSERTVRRILHRLQNALEDSLLPSDP